MARPKNYVLNPRLKTDDFVMVSLPLPKMMDALTLSRSEEIKKAVAELHRQMAARKWVEDRPPEQAKTLTPLTLGKVVDHNQDGLPTLFVYALKEGLGKSVFIKRQK